MPEIDSPTDTVIVRFLHATECSREREEADEALRSGVVDREDWRRELIRLTIREFNEDIKPFSKWLEEPEQEPLAASIRSKIPAPITHSMLLSIQGSLGTEEIIDRLSAAPGIKSVSPDNRVNLIQ